MSSTFRKGLMALFSGSGKDKFSLHRFQSLLQSLSKHLQLNESNQAVIVENIREMTEIIIWGDQNDPRIIDFFLEQDVLNHLLKFLKQHSHKAVKVQVIQSLSMLIHNLKNEMAVYFILSNNHVNYTITQSFDLYDEELLGLYVSFLRTLSLRLNDSTVQLFFNSRTQDFPLCSEALKLFDHPEYQVRVAIRTLTLNIFKLREPLVQRFIIEKPAVPYLTSLMYFLGDRLSTCQEARKNGSLVPQDADEVLDVLFYLRDIMDIDFTALQVLVSQRFFGHIVKSLVIPSMTPVQVSSASSAGQRKRRAEKNTADPAVVLSLMALSLHVVGKAHISDAILQALLLHPSYEGNSGYGELAASILADDEAASVSSLPRSLSLSTPRGAGSHAQSMPGASSLTSRSAASVHSSRSHPSPTAAADSQYMRRNECRTTICSCLGGAERATKPALYFVLAATVGCQASHNMQEAAGVLPVRKWRSRQLLSALTTPDTTESGQVSSQAGPESSIEEEGSKSTLASPNRVTHDEKQRTSQSDGKSSNGSISTSNHSKSRSSTKASTSDEVDGEEDFHDAHSSFASTTSSAAMNNGTSYSPLAMDLFSAVVDTVERGSLDIVELGVAVLLQIVCADAGSTARMMEQAISMQSQMVSVVKKSLSQVAGIVRGFLPTSAGQVVCELMSLELQRTMTIDAARVLSSGAAMDCLFSNDQTGPGHLTEAEKMKVVLRRFAGLATVLDVIRGGVLSDSGSSGIQWKAPTPVNFEKGELVHTGDELLLECMLASDRQSYRVLVEGQCLVLLSPSESIGNAGIVHFSVPLHRIVDIRPWASDRRGLEVCYLPIAKDVLELASTQSQPVVNLLSNVRQVHILTFQDRVAAEQELEHLRKHLMVVRNAWIASALAVLDSTSL